MFVAWSVAFIKTYLGSRLRIIVTFYLFLLLLRDLVQCLL